MRKNNFAIVALVAQFFGGGIPLVNALKTIKYGTDVSFPMHYSTLSELPTEKNLFGTNKQQIYEENLEECARYYDEEHKAKHPDEEIDPANSPGRNACMETETERLAMNLRQPQSMVNYTQTGFVKIRAPPEVWNLVQTFWKQNKDALMEENWPRGSIFVNHWKSTVHFVAVENATLAGGGQILKTAIWNAARDTLQEWTGWTMADCSLYGVRIYHQDAILAPHVDRLPLVASAILNVDQDVDEPWPLEVIGHDGRAHNVTMEPGDLILYESHSVIHGRPFPLKGRFMANIFIHFEPVAPLSEPNPVFTGDLPPYVIPNSPEEPNWRKQHPEGWHAVQTKPVTAGTTEVHQMAGKGDITQLEALLDAHPHLVNARDENGWTPLHESLRLLRGDVIHLLIERGADVHATTNGGDSVLGLAYYLVASSDKKYETEPQTHPLIEYLEGLGATYARDTKPNDSEEL